MDELALEFDTATTHTSTKTGRLKSRPSRNEMLNKTNLRKALEGRDLHVMTMAMLQDTDTMGVYGEREGAKSSSNPNLNGNLNGNLNCNPHHVAVTTTTTYTAYKGGSMHSRETAAGTTLTIPARSSQFKGENALDRTVSIHIPSTVGVSTSGHNGSVIIGKARGSHANRTMMRASSFFRSEGVTTKGLAESHGQALGALAMGRVGDAVQGLSLIGRSVPTSAAVYCTLGVLYDNEVQVRGEHTDGES